ncbi:hypothetical protein [Acinetobacter bereziniae]|uniref:hypothetical protein n=1 Tax=Acinetobacter bereziniae TaxID=106648 RepID=UPI003008E4CC
MNKSYMTNFGIETGNDNFIFITSHSLDHKFAEKPDEIIDKCHIYCVVDCPRITFIPESLEYKISDNFLTYTVALEYRCDGENKIVHFKDSFEVQENVTQVKIDQYPHSDLVIMDADNKIIMSCTAVKLAYMCGIPDIISMKVLYIGKSTGIKQKKNALDRVKSHSTLQKILADRNARYPDRSVLVGLFNFCPVRLYSFIDGMDNSKISGDEDFARLNRIRNFKLSLEQKTAIIEAALVRYFEPEYNKKLKKDIPSKKSKVLAECYSYDISAILVKFWTSEENDPSLNYYLYSDKVAKNARHNISIELIDPKVRKGFFSIGDKDWALEGTIRRNKNSL